MDNAFKDANVKTVRRRRNIVLVGKIGSELSRYTQVPL